MDSGTSNYTEAMPLLNENEKSKTINEKQNDNESINLKEAFYIMVGFSMGSGMLVMPHIITVLGMLGWIIALMTIVILQCTCTILLSRCTQRCVDDEDKSQICDPYQVTAQHAGGSNLRKVSVVVMYFCDVSVAIVMFLLSSNIFAVSIPITSELKANEQIWLAVLVLVLTPFMFLGTYTHLKLPAFISLLSALSSGILILVNCVIKEKYLPSKTIQSPVGGHGMLTQFSNIFISLGTILFGTNGPSQVICNLTALAKTKEKLHRPIVISYICMFFIYVISGFIPYNVFNGEIESSIVETFSNYIKNSSDEHNQSIRLFQGISVAVQILMSIHLLPASVLSMNPVFLHLEKVLNIPNKLSWKRMTLRGLCMAVILIFCLVIPNFQLALGVSGGVPLTILSVVLPLFMTLRIFSPNLYQKVIIFFFIGLAILFAIGNLVASIIGLV